MSDTPAAAPPPAPAPAPNGTRTVRRLIFLDLNTFFAPRAGGIRTYHLCKLAYFTRHPDHDYVFVHPGPRHAIVSEAANVTRIELWGPVVSADRRGYRFLLDAVSLIRHVLRLKPDVVEVGEPWVAGFVMGALRLFRLYRGRLVYFCHSDPMMTHVVPWAEAAPRRLYKDVARALCGVYFYRGARLYDTIVVTSQGMVDHLARHDLSAVRLPFGVPDGFLDRPPPVRDADPERPVHLLYSGRLNPEKGVRLVLAGLPRLLADPRVRITVIGRGPLTPEFAAFTHPRYEFVGFVEDRDEVVRIYDRHDVLLATGPYESFGLAVLEAMARGLTVVGSDLGGTAELLRRAHSPFVFRADDLDDFVRVVHAAVAADRREVAARSRAVAEEHGDFDTAIARMIHHHAAGLDDPSSA